PRPALRGPFAFLRAKKGAGITPPALLSLVRLSPSSPSWCIASFDILAVFPTIPCFPEHGSDNSAPTDPYKAKKIPLRLSFQAKRKINFIYFSMDYRYLASSERFRPAKLRCYRLHAL